MSNSSIGRGPAFGGNENHDGNPQSKTLGESVYQEPPAGNDVNELPDEARPDVSGDSAKPRADKAAPR
jgi:hypothetical protein